jgi:hypothetical protein
LACPASSKIRKQPPVQQASRQGRFALICLALADLKTKTIISKGVARALPERIDPTPVSFFAETPAFTKDASTDAYIKSCQGTKVGDTIDQAYADRIVVASLINDGIEAYDAGHYRDALDVYQAALKTPGGDNCACSTASISPITSFAAKAAMDAFGKVIDYGLKSDKLAVKFLFKPGSTQFSTDRSIRAPYDAWLEKIAERTAAKQGCLEIVGHGSATGLPAITIGFPACAPITSGTVWKTTSIRCANG